MSSPRGSDRFDEVLWSPHASEKMVERSIEAMEVADTLTFPHRLYPGNKPGRRVAERDRPDGSTIRVVYVIEDSNEAFDKIFPGDPATRRRRRAERSLQYEAHLAAVVVTVIRIRKRK